MGNDLEKRVGDLERELEELKRRIADERSEARRRRRMGRWYYLTMIFMIAVAYVWYVKSIDGLMG